MLTPLERELLTSVEKLTLTCEASLGSLKKSEEALNYSQQRVSALSRMIEEYLMPCVLASARLQTDLLEFWSVSSQDQIELSRLRRAMEQQSGKLNGQIQHLQQSVSRIGR